MSHHLRTLLAGAAIALLSTGLPARTQEPPAPEPAEPPPSEAVSGETPSETEKERPVKFFLEAAAWYAHPYGSDFSPVTTSSAFEPWRSETTRLEQTDEQEWRYRVGVRAKDPQWGGLEFIYWSQGQTDRLKILRPGEFVFTESLPDAELAGFKNDRLADGFDATLRQSVRDTRILYTRLGLDGPRFDVDWHVGLRFVDYGRAQDASYYAILPPDLPPLNAPDDAQGFTPVPDVAQQVSSFSGRGLEVGVDGRLQILTSLRFDAGVSVAALRGSTDASYQSATPAYVDPDGVILPGEDYGEYFAENPDGGNLSQIVFQRGFSSRSSTSAFVWEAYIEARWRFWRTMEAFAGGRSVRYEDVLSVMRPEIGAAYSATTESVGYEGFYLGLAFTY